MTDWEISVEQQDFINGQVEYGKWYVQAFRVWADASGKHHEYYWNLPNTDRWHRVTRTSPPSYGNVDPPLPALNWGDAPWNPGKEVYSGIIRGIQIYAARLTMEDIISESRNPLSTSEGKASIWYLNSNPTPADISDKSGKGNNPSWVGNERPSLFTADKEPEYTTVIVNKTFIITRLSIAAGIAVSVAISFLLWRRLFGKR